ncbi:DUF4302 domain-containing protein [Myroides sp. mNGS23_01]|nr:DUF4302 domain-containing protein [Myroides sp. mNGS23_01]WHT40914.1 DUF4302 domain-containing protein [Myroides sp. mNGS23_01]
MLSLFAVGCQDTDPDDVFGEKANVRIENARKELNSALLDSEYGWKMIYFTDDSQLGGFTHLIKFDNQVMNSVKMISDFNASTLIPKESTYTLPMASTISLLYATPNHIHELGKGNQYPVGSLKGKGYLGDNQFLFYGYDGDVLTLRGNRGLFDIKLTKATAEDWANLRNNTNVMNVIAQKRNMVVVENEEAQIYNFRFTKSTRYATVLNNEQTMSVNTAGGVGIGFNIDEVVVSPAIEFEDGSTISVLKFENGTFKGEVGNNSVTIM